MMNTATQSTLHTHTHALVPVLKGRLQTFACRASSATRMLNTPSLVFARESIEVAEKMLHFLA